MACGSVLALLLTLLLAPAAPWRLPLALVGGLWAPGYALLAAVHPLRREGPSGWERHAMGFALGLLVAPVVGLLVSLLLAFEDAPVAGSLCALTFACAAVGFLRGSEAAPFVHATPPSTRATLAVCVATLVALLALSFAPVPGASPEAPTAVALVGPDGRASSLPLRLEQGGDGLALAEVLAGARGETGVLRVTWTPADAEAQETLMVERLALRPGEAVRRELVLPTDEPGLHRLEVRWEGRSERVAHAWVQVVAAPTEAEA